MEMNSLNMQRIVSSPRGRALQRSFVGHKIQPRDPSMSVTRLCARCWNSYHPLFKSTPGVYPPSPGVKTLSSTGYGEVFVQVSAAQELRTTLNERCRAEKQRAPIEDSRIAI